MNLRPFLEDTSISAAFLATVATVTDTASPSFRKLDKLFVLCYNNYGPTVSPFLVHQTQRYRKVTKRV